MFMGQVCWRYREGRIDSSSVPHLIRPAGAGHLLLEGEGGIHHLRRLRRDTFSLKEKGGYIIRADEAGHLLLKEKEMALSHRYL